MTEELVWIHVSDLGPNSRGANIHLKAISHTEEREVTSRRDGATHRVCEVLMGDETGVVFLTVWDDMIEKVEDGKIYTLKNGYTSLFRGNIRLNVGKYGTIEESEEAVETVNEENNISEKTYDRPPRFRRSRDDNRGGSRGGGGDRR